ncbi:hypothetical protein [Candidatus Williamhamiltonella defendens]|uniref:hypothetical protein n=1 Tax=Candidatus Williamhamiltonella defendens TaxID=138072 RepID=UPI00158228EC|nr:hypothetical protein [Candidatus Hamiltonella defensa]
MKGKINHHLHPYSKALREIENFYQKNNASTSTTNNTNYYKTETIAGKFYQLIYQKMIDRLITVKQYEKLYEEISEQMKSKSFTIEEINQFCENNNIPTFREDELFRIAKKDKNTVDPNSEYIEIFKIIEANTDLTKNEREGIPTYVAGLSKGENAIHFLSDLKNHLDEKNFNRSLTLKNLLSDQFLKDNNLSHYIAGPVVIAYFEDMFPNVIDELLYDTKDMVEENKEEFFKKIQKLYDEAYSTPFKNWVETHSNEGFHAWLEPAPTKNQDGDGSSAEVTSLSKDALKPEVDSSFQQGDSHQNEAGLLKQGMSQFSSHDAPHVPENPVLHSDVIPTVISNAS